ncbi:MAG: hypothetical protein AAGD25_30130 [Cyanobacteria bacterium P01_F01_bin.150]
MGRNLHEIMHSLPQDRQQAIANRSRQLIAEAESTVLPEEQQKILLAIHNRYPNYLNSSELATKLDLDYSLTVYSMKEIEKLGYINCLNARDYNLPYELVGSLTPKGKVFVENPEKLIMPESEPKYDLRGAYIAGGVGNIGNGNQNGGIINNYGNHAKEEIADLISALREQAQHFPSEQKEDALDELDSLDLELSSNSDIHKISRRLKRLRRAAIAVAAIVGGTATFSGDVNTFTDNVVKLTETLGIPIEQIQPGERSSDIAP